MTEGEILSLHVHAVHAVSASLSVKSKLVTQQSTRCSNFSYTEAPTGVQVIEYVQWVPDYPNSRLSECLDVAMFSKAVEKRRSCHWISATGESKAAV